MPNANWSNPTLTSTYTNFVSEVKNRDEDLALQFDGTTSTNIPTNAIRWDSSAGRWKKWNGSAWVELAATYALTNITATGTLNTGDSIQAGTNGGNVGIYVGQTGYSGALLYRADGSVQLSARSGYGLTFAPAPNSSTTWAQFSPGGFFGLGIAPTTKLHVVGTQVTDAGLSATVGPAFSNNTTNNADTPGLQTAFTIGRDGKAGVSYGNFVNFNIGRYSQSGFASQTQLTLRLSNGNQNNPEVDVLTLLGNGNVGIGTTSPQATLHAYGGLGEIIRVESNSSSDGYILFKNTSGSISVGMSGAASNALLIYDRVNAHSAYTYAGGASGYHIWYVNNTERARIDSSGRLLVGTSSAASTANTGANAQVQIEAATTYAAQSIRTNSNDATPPYLSFGKSRGITAGSNTVVTNNDYLGFIAFDGADGSAQRTGAAIYAQVDATPGANDMPGRLVFSTTADGSSTPTERVRIDSSGLFTALNGISGAVTRATAVGVSGSSSVSWGSIPSWVKQISIHLREVSLNGTDNMLVQLSTGGTFLTSGHAAGFGYTDTFGGAVAGVTSANGFIIGLGDPANIQAGTYTFTNITGTVWVGQYSGIYQNSARYVAYGAGTVNLAGTLDGIRLIPTGSNTFVAGAVNITYQG